MNQIVSRCEPRLVEKCKMEMGVASERTYVRDEYLVTYTNGNLIYYIVQFGHVMECEVSILVVFNCV